MDAVFHPAYKLIYFKLAKWQIEWIETSREMVRAEFDRKYARPAPIIPVVIKPKTLLDTLPMLRPRPTAIAQDELDIYLGSDTEETDDPISWWVDNAGRFPTLSRMALDYLNIPGTCIIYILELH
jgi:hypothetical protein